MYSFYKDVIEYKGFLVRGIHEGEEFKEKVNFRLSLYAITQNKTNHKTLQGQYLKHPITFDSIYKCETSKEIILILLSLIRKRQISFSYIAKNYMSDEV